MPELLTVKAVEDKTSQTGQRYWRVQDARNRWHGYFHGIAPLIGAAYLAEIEVDAKNRSTIRSLAPAGAIPEANDARRHVATAQNGTSPGPERAAPVTPGPDARDARIASQVALYAAVYMLRGMREPPSDPKELSDLVLRWADRNLLWLDQKATVG